MSISDSGNPNGQYWFKAFTFANANARKALGERYDQVMAYFSNAWIAAQTFRDLATGMERLTTMAQKLPGTKAKVLAKVLGEPDQDPDDACH